jgi:hypothetical protein
MPRCRGPPLTPGVTQAELDARREAMEGKEPVVMSDQNLDGPSPSS